MSAYKFAITRDPCDLDTCRRAKFEAMLLMNTWKVDYDDIEPLKAGKKGGSTVSWICILLRMITEHANNSYRTISL